MKLDIFFKVQTAGIFSTTHNTQCIMDARDLKNNPKLGLEQDMEKNIHKKYTEQFLPKTNYIIYTWVRVWSLERFGNSPCMTWLDFVIISL